MQLWLKPSVTAMSSVLYAELAKEADVLVAAVKKVMQSLSGVVGQRLRVGGKMRIPGFAKLTLVLKKGAPPREKVVFGRKIQIDRRPAMKHVKIVPAKPLIDVAVD